MSDYILFADDEDFRCDDCGKKAILVTGGGDILCEYCYGISLGMEPTEEDLIKKERVEYSKIGGWGV